ncbi:MAG: glycosyltransferase family 39 protein [Planctomycetes bacterium]|nr:glycosyltransferase family 39 protein [Planctomycetota bacterium]
MRFATWAVGLVVVIAAWAVCANLGAAPPGRMSEQRCHRVAVHMVKSGAWIVPIDHGLPRLQKPPLYYWLAATAVMVSGEVSYAMTRLPSALAAVLLLVVTFHWAKRYGGTSAGLLAVVALLSTDQFQDNARRGDAEMVFALASVAALLTLQRAVESGRGRDLTWFAVAFALAVLAKATAALVTVLVPIAAWAVFDARVRARLDRGFALAVLAAACAGFAWYGVVLTRVVGAWSELVGHAARPLGVDDPGGDADHYRAPYFFVKQLPSILGPIVVGVPWLAWQAWRSRREIPRPASLVAGIAFAAMFVAFSVVPQKQPHYLLPAIPVLCVSLALALERRLRAATMEFAVLRLCVVGLALGVAGYGAVEWTWARAFVPGADVVASALAACGVLVAVVAVAIALRGREATAWRTLAIACALVVAVRAAHVAPWRATIKAATEGEIAVVDIAGVADVALVSRIAHVQAAAAEHRVAAWVFDVDDALTKDD